jgi:plastocyanin
MRRSFTVFAVCALLLVAAGCSKQRDTGFPPIQPSSSSSASASPSTPTTPVTAQTIIAKGIQWDLKQLLFKANATVTVTVDNQDAGVPHNFGVYSDAQRTKEIDKPAGDVTGPAKKDYPIKPLKAGTYYFQCDIHPNMNGTITVK